MNVCLLLQCPDSHGSLLMIQGYYHLNSTMLFIIVIMLVHFLTNIINNICVLCLVLCLFFVSISWVQVEAITHSIP